jgi:hypothetical protein
MPSEGFHVHGVHDHAVEHAAEHGGDKLAGRIAVASAILATLGAMMGFAGGDTQAKAQVYKNDAAITKTEANDKWNYYQAKGVKKNTAEVAATLMTKPEKAEKYLADAERYKKEQDKIKEEAEAFEEKVKDLNRESDHEMHVHHRWALGATAMQIAIALSAIALLSRKTWLLYGVGIVSVGGLVAGGLALAGV